MGKERVIKIIMNRDGISHSKAKDIVEETIDLMNEAIEEGNPFECEDILVDQLGLEPDYLFDLIDI